MLFRGVRYGRMRGDIMEGGRLQGEVGHRDLQEGGGGLWHFTFVWAISRFKLTTKFPTRNSGFSANFWHTSGTLWWVVIHSTRELCEISHTEIYHRECDLAQTFPPSCRDLLEHIPWLREDAGELLQLRWVPSHLNVKGNEAADEFGWKGRG